MSGDAFGIKAWTTADHAYQEFFSDDNARGLLGAVATAGPQKRGNIKATWVIFLIPLAHLHVPRAHAGVCRGASCAQTSKQIRIDRRSSIADRPFVGLLKTDRWHSTIATGVLGNLRQVAH